MFQLQRWRKQLPTTAQNDHQGSIACGLLLPAEPRPEQNDTDQVAEDDYEIEKLH
jgi:hypothetical protein